MKLAFHFISEAIYLLKRNFPSGRRGEGNELIRNGLRLGYE